VSSRTASPRGDDDSKAVLSALPTERATRVDGVLVGDSCVHLECTLHTVVDGFGENSLIVGQVVAASADASYLRVSDLDEGEQLVQAPLLAYVSPGRFASIGLTTRFPFPEGFSR